MHSTETRNSKQLPLAFPMIVKYVVLYSQPNKQGIYNQKKMKMLKL